MKIQVQVSWVGQSAREKTSDHNGTEIGNQYKRDLSYQNKNHNEHLCQKHVWDSFAMWWGNQWHKLKVEKTTTNMCLHWSEARLITGDQSSEYSKLLISRGPTDLLMRRVAIFWSTPPQAQPVDNLRRRQTPSAADGSLGVKMLDGRVFGLSHHAFCSPPTLWNV